MIVGGIWKLASLYCFAMVRKQVVSIIVIIIIQSGNSSEKRKLSKICFQKVISYANPAQLSSVASDVALNEVHVVG